MSLTPFHPPGKTRVRRSSPTISDSAIVFLWKTRCWNAYIRPGDLMISNPIRRYGAAILMLLTCIFSGSVLATTHTATKSHKAPTVKKISSTKALVLLIFFTVGALWLFVAVCVVANTLPEKMQVSNISMAAPYRRMGFDIIRSPGRIYAFQHLVFHKKTIAESLIVGELLLTRVLPGGWKGVSDTAQKIG